MDAWGTWSEIVVPFVTMVATIVLAGFTWVLARATKQLAKSSLQPQVTATIQPNLWSMIHCNLVVENSGNAAAYDVVLVITPVPKQAEARGDNELPLRNISVLRPGQEMKSFLADFESVADQEFKMEVSWKRHPRDKRRDKVSYHHRLPRGISRLGAWNPEFQMAESLKKMREDWQQIARGQRKLKVDGYLKEDREEERHAIEQLRAKRQKRRAGTAVRDWRDGTAQRWCLGEREHLGEPHTGVEAKAEGVAGDWVAHRGFEASVPARQHLGRRLDATAARAMQRRTGRCGARRGLRLGRGRNRPACGPRTPGRATAGCSRPVSRSA